MTFLFGSHLSFREKIRAIAKLAGEHATNLAAFACLYKVGANNAMFMLHYQYFQLNFDRMSLYVPYVSSDDAGHAQSVESKNKPRCSSWSSSSIE